jgi:uncharacterized membrane protein
MDPRRRRRGHKRAERAQRAAAHALQARFVPPIRGGEVNRMQPQIEHADTIEAIRARAADQRTLAQRLIERGTTAVGSPVAVVGLLALVAAWLVANGLAAPGRALDPPPFAWLSGAVSLYAAVVGTFVLATQNREKRHAEQRAYFELQVNLLAEQKAAKIIALLEELRRDMPSVPNRVDPQARALQEPVDAAAVLQAFEDEESDSAPPRPSA